MHLLTITGARPQFIKCAPVSAALREYHTEYLVHTGQHYDDTMSRIFFEEMHIPRPDINLEVGSASHAVQTSLMLERLEPVMAEQNPDAVIIYGDTNSTLAGALTAAKLDIPIVHIEAGLRSFNRTMPEEINRIVADRLSSILCCPSETAVQNLYTEGITNRVVNTGDVMYDAILYFKSLYERSTILDQLGISAGEYVLVTVHRASNTDNIQNIQAILAGLNDSGKRCIFPVHPRTRKVIQDNRLTTGGYPNISFIQPLGYLDFMAAAAHAAAMVTDSGGVQKEAYWHGIPCITVRTETEWIETVEAGWNIITGTDSTKITEAINTFKPAGNRPEYFGNGHAARKIVQAIST